MDSPIFRKVEVAAHAAPIVGYMIQTIMWIKEQLNSYKFAVKECGVMYERLSILQSVLSKESDSPAGKLAVCALAKKLDEIKANVTRFLGRKRGFLKRILFGNTDKGLILDLSRGLADAILDLLVSMGVETAVELKRVVPEIQGVPERTVKLLLSRLAGLSMENSAPPCFRGIPTVTLESLSMPNGGKWTVNGSHAACVGRGGFGAVYSARHVVVGRVAVKLFDVSGLSAKSLKDFAGECRHHMMVASHPNIVGFYGAVIDRNHGCFGMMMDLARGGNLWESINDDDGDLWSKLPVKVRLQSLSRIVSAVSYLHSKKMFHADIKLENILLATPLQEGSLEVPELWLADFGLSHTAQSVRASTKRSTFVENCGKGGGTMGYLAPEVLRGQPCTAASDIFSLSILLWAALACEQPFPSCTNLDHYHIAIKEGTRPDLSCLPVENPRLFALLSKCWKGRSSLRPSAEEVCAELEAILEELEEQPEQEASAVELLHAEHISASVELVESGFICRSGSCDAVVVKLTVPPAFSSSMVETELIGEIGGKENVKMAAAKIKGSGSESFPVACWNGGTVTSCRLRPVGTERWKDVAVSLSIGEFFESATICAAFRSMKHGIRAAKIGSDTFKSMCSPRLCSPMLLWSAIAAFFAIAAGLLFLLARAVRETSESSSWSTWSGETVSIVSRFWSEEEPSYSTVSPSFCYSALALLAGAFFGFIVFRARRAPIFSTLEHLDLSNTALGDSGAAALGDVAALLPCLRVLCLRSCRLKSDGAVTLAAALPSLRSLQVLELNGNAICEEGAAALIAILPTLPCLQELRLADSDIGAEGAAALATVVPLVSSLQVLGLSFARPGGGGTLASFFRPLSALKKRFFRHQRTVSLAAFAARIPSLSLEKLDLSRKAIEDDVKAKLKFDLE